MEGRDLVVAIVPTEAEQQEASLDLRSPGDTFTLNRGFDLVSALLGSEVEGVKFISVRERTWKDLSRQAYGKDLSPVSLFDGIPGLSQERLPAPTV